jgi:hypothetical protein
VKILVSKSRGQESKQNLSGWLKEMGKAQSTQTQQQRRDKLAKQRSDSRENLQNNFSNTTISQK